MVRSSSPKPFDSPSPLGPHLEIVVLGAQLFQLPHQAAGPAVQHLLGEVGEGKRGAEWQATAAHRRCGHRRLIWGGGRPRRLLPRRRGLGWLPGAGPRRATRRRFGVAAQSQFQAQQARLLRRAVRHLGAAVGEAGRRRRRARPGTRTRAALGADPRAYPGHPRPRAPDSGRHRASLLVRPRRGRGATSCSGARACATAALGQRPAGHVLGPSWRRRAVALLPFRGGRGCRRGTVAPRR